MCALPPLVNQLVKKVEIVPAQRAHEGVSCARRSFSAGGLMTTTSTQERRLAKCIPWRTDASK
jgi:hypothetical protein